MKRAAGGRRDGQFFTAFRKVPAGSSLPASDRNRHPRADGQAGVWGMRWNRTPGPFELRILAIKGQAARAGTSAVQALNDAPESKRLAGVSVAAREVTNPVDLAGGRGSGGRGNRGRWFRERQHSGGNGCGGGDGERRADQGSDDHPWGGHETVSGLLVMSACAFAQIEHPQIGVMLDENGDARVVLGVAGSTTSSDSLWSGVLSLACSAQVCFAKSQGALLSSSGESMDAPAGPAIFAIDGATAYVYFPGDAATRPLARRTTPACRFHTPTP